MVSSKFITFLVQVTERIQAKANIEKMLSKKLETLHIYILPLLGKEEKGVILAVSFKKAKEYKKELFLFLTLLMEWNGVSVVWQSVWHRPYI